MTFPEPIHGLLLVHSEPAPVRQWASRGLVAVRVEPCGPWTAVTPAGPVSRAAEPYDDALSALASRPLGPRLRPSVGFFVTGDVGVVSARDSGWRALQRWVFWSPDTGPHHSDQLPPLHVDELADVVGLRGSLRDVEAALDADATDALDWLLGIHGALGLPGGRLLRDGASQRSVLVEPDPASVRSFDRLAAEELAHRAELGGTP